MPASISLLALRFLLPSPLAGASGGVAGVLSWIGDRYPLFAGLVIFLVLSGVATGLSWLCYYRALQMAPASRVAPIDKMSVALVIVFAVLFLGEPLDWKMALGGTFVVVGAFLLALT